MARKAINTTIDEDLIKDVKILAIKKDCKINDLIEEGLKSILDKYKNDNQGWKTFGYFFYFKIVLTTKQHSIILNITTKQHNYKRGVKQMATKDYMKFRTNIKKDTSLNLEESYLLEVLYDYYNISLKYAYPSYEVLLHDLKTTRKAKVSKLLKSLVAKGYIQISKKGRSNTYKLLKHLYITDDKKKITPEEVVGELEVDTDDIENITSNTTFNAKQAKELLIASRGRFKVVMNNYDYVRRKRNVKDVYRYCLWAIENSIAKDDNVIPLNPYSFNNFTPREYDYETLERKLLGWD